jgi:CTP:molybdopterin cytidylyltransferase MocA
VARYPSHAVEVDDAGVLVDIDTEADLRLARATPGEVVTAPQQQAANG